jgi:hypothetical protein
MDGAARIGERGGSGASSRHGPRARKAGYSIPASESCSEVPTELQVANAVHNTCQLQPRLVQQSIIQQIVRCQLSATLLLKVNRKRIGGMVKGDNPKMSSRSYLAHVHSVNKSWLAFSPCERLGGSRALTEISPGLLI